MSERTHTKLAPRVHELNALLKEGSAHWRNKEALNAEQDFLAAAELRSKLSKHADELLKDEIDLDKVDKILACTLSNFSVINLERNQPDRALELALRAADLLKSKGGIGSEYEEALELVSEIRDQLKNPPEKDVPDPKVKKPRKRSRAGKP